jgi:hypothetical protein
VQSGLIAARLARHGMTASPDAIEHPAGLLRRSARASVDRTRASRLGQHWAILEIGLNIKLYPICYGAHRITDGMIDLRRQHALAAHDIQSAAIEIGETQATILRNHRPQNALDAVQRRVRLPPRPRLPAIAACRGQRGVRAAARCAGGLSQGPDIHPHRPIAGGDVARRL